MDGSDKQNIKLILGEIIKGYSTIKIGDKKIYLKHFSISDQVELDELEGKVYEEAILSGIKSQKELLERAKEFGVWTDKEDLEIKELQPVIEKAEANAAKQLDPNVKKALLKSVEELNEDLRKLHKKKNKLVFYSAESLATDKKVKEMLNISLFKDKTFKNKIDDSDLELFASEAIDKLTCFYNLETMLRVSYEELFFEAFVYQSNNPMIIFGSKFEEITLYQHKILSFANSLFNKIKNSSYMTLETMKDAVLVYNHKDKEPDKKLEKSRAPMLNKVASGYKKGENVPIHKLG